MTLPFELRLYTGAEMLEVLRNAELVIDVEECGKDLLQMRRYNTQISDLFALSIKSLSTAALPPFFRYLTEKDKSIHYRDLQPTPVEEIEGTNDPRTGTAYYFTASGNQLWKMPQYEKNLKDNKNREPRRDQD